MSGEPARCHLKGRAARKVEQQGGQEKERRRRCRQEKVSTHCGWGQRAQLAWQPDPPSRLPSSQPSLLLNCFADHLNCSANQQTSLKQFDLVLTLYYTRASQNAAAKFPAEGEEGEDQREGSLPTRELPTTLLISLPPSSAPRTRSLNPPAPHHQHRTFLKIIADY